MSRQFHSLSHTSKEHSKKYIALKLYLLIIFFCKKNCCKAPSSRCLHYRSGLLLSLLLYTAILRKVVGKNVHATIPKGNIGYDQYAVPDTVAVESSVVAFL